VKGWLLRNFYVFPVEPMKGSLVAGPEPHRYWDRREPTGGGPDPADEIQPGLSMRRAIALVQELGGRVEWLNGTGEVIFEHPAYRRRVRANSRKKDAPRAVLPLLRAAIRK
jgi:hypothetical protein